MTDASDAGRALVAHRPTVTIQCEVCGKEKTVRAKSGARTCGATCRSKLRRELARLERRDHEGE